MTRSRWLSHVTLQNLCVPPSESSHPLCQNHPESTCAGMEEGLDKEHIEATFWVALECSWTYDFSIRMHIIRWGWSLTEAKRSAGLTVLWPAVQSRTVSAWTWAERKKWSFSAICQLCKKKAGLIGVRWMYERSVRQTGLLEFPVRKTSTASSVKGNSHYRACCMEIPWWRAGQQQPPVNPQ